MPTQFLPIPGTPDGVKRLFDRRDLPLVLVSRHGLGDNLFCSPCFEPLRLIFPRVYFASSVNAYASIFYSSPLVDVLYAGGVNGCNLGLDSAAGFAAHFERLKLDLGVPEALVYHFGLFEPHLPYEDERAFVKGRRNYVELFDTGPPAIETPRYHVAPDGATRACVQGIISRWLPHRELIVFARYGHTDGGKNFGDDSQAVIETIRRLEQRRPGEFKFVTLDYTPGEHAADGRLPYVRSVYGFLPCDAASLYHLLAQARVLVTVPSGPMLVGAALPQLKLLTLWKTMPPLHFLDPQWGSQNPVHALVEREDLVRTAFMDRWPIAARSAVLGRWKMRVGPITPLSVADAVLRVMEESP